MDNYPYTYTRNPDSDEPIMTINSHIGVNEEDGAGVIGALFQDELLHLDSLNKKRIQVWINSPGGSVLDGYAIYTAINKSKTKVDTYCGGMAASIAAVIFQAGRNRVMADYGVLMYHNPFGSDDKGMLSAMRDSLITMICEKSGMDRDQMGRLMNRTTYVLANEAFDMGLCDHVESSTDLNVKRSNGVLNSQTRADIPMADYWKECREVMNSLLPTKKNTMSLKKVCNKLKLNEESSEDAVLDAVNSLEARALRAEADLAAFNKYTPKDFEEMENKVKMAEEAANSKKKEFDEMKNALDAMKKEKEDAENSAKAEKAQNLVNSYVVSGRLSKEGAVDWIDQAISDFDKAKNMLEKLPVNKSAVKIPLNTMSSQEESASIYKGGVATDMLKIQNKMESAR